MEEDYNDPLINVYIPSSLQRSRGSETRTVECSLPARRVLLRAVAVILVVALLVTVIVLGVLLHEAQHNSEEEHVGTTAAGSGGEGTTAGPTAVGPTTAGPEAWWQVRLPKNVIPDHYDILLRVDLVKFRFDGEVNILVNVTEQTDLILVHTNEMNVTEVGVQTKSGDSVRVKKHFWFKKNQFYVLMMDSRLERGQYVVKMKYEAFLATDMHGLYKSNYTNKAGKTVNLAATQFQPTDARRAFPCFDEPALKATFTVTLVHDPELISVSNMPIEKTETKDGWKHDHFEKTVVMPTYLMAFLVCDFGSNTTTTKSGVKMTFYAPKDQVDQLAYAVETGREIMEYMEGHFNIPFPLPKCDMAAVPDFAAGAMENWGLILYRETALLYKPGVSSEANKQRVAAVISHELAHMWFGNLVTMKWWDDLWLNEGFASFVEYLGVNHVHPDWDMMTYFVTADLVYAFSLDGLQSSHPIKVPVNHPDEINQIFDSISYNKGASIIRMLRYFLGENVFDRGLTRYLNKHKYSNAETDDLWKELRQESCDQGHCVNVKQMMDTWTLQMNYPVVSVTKNGGNFDATQERFLFDPEANVTSKYTADYKWVIPFTYITKNSPNEKKSVVLNKTSASFPDDGSSWVKGNVGQTGLYRVNYDESNWKALRDQLKSQPKVFNTSDRAALIDDAFDLARGGRLNYTIAMDMTTYLDTEKEYVPWDAATSGMYGITGNVAKTSTLNQNMRKYLKLQSDKLFPELGFNDTKGHLEAYLRNLVLNIQCGAGEEKCLEKAAEYFMKWMEDPVTNPVPPDFRSLVYFYGIKKGGRKEWDFAFEQFKKTAVASERRKLLYALSATEVPWLLSRYLSYVLDESKIKKQDGTAVVSYVANYNPSCGQQMAWDFFRLNWKTLAKRYGGGFFAMRSLISSVTSGFAEEYRLQEVLAFKDANKDSLGTGARAMDQAVERIRAKIRWRQRNEATIEQWLQNYLTKN